MCKENKNNDFIQQFCLFHVSLQHVFMRVLCVCIPLSSMSLLHFWALNVVLALLSMKGHKALGFHQKYLNLCSEYEQRSYRFGMTWGWVIDDRIFIFGWTNPLSSISIYQFIALYAFEWTHSVGCLEKFRRNSATFLLLKMLAAFLFYTFITVGCLKCWHL